MQDSLQDQSWINLIKNFPLVKLLCVYACSFVLHWDDSDSVYSKLKNTKNCYFFLLICLI